MTRRRPCLALGLMSGTSLDGIDAALLRTDGEGVVVPGAALTMPYRGELRERLRALVDDASPDERAVAAVADVLTRAHADAVAALLARAGRTAEDIAVIGFHGHTIAHRPAEGWSRQIGDGAWLAAETGIDVVDDFRARDLATGGQGAPLVPLYHAARCVGLPRPLAVLNIGGVANVTYVGDGPGDALLAFDTGPGNALIDDWVRKHTGAAMDEDGALAARGAVSGPVLERLLDAAYFRLTPPKSLDRGDFDAAPFATLSPEDGAATLAAFTAAAAARAARHFPAPARRWLVCGGGRRNPAIMAALQRELAVPVAPVEAVGWNGDALEAEAFAYLAVRALARLPLTVPGTTGCRRPVTGGALHPAAFGRR